MKKSEFENSFPAYPFNAKPPFSATAANMASKGVRVGQNSAMRTSGPTSPTSVPSDSSPFRSTSSSPRRHMSPDCKLKIVSAGNSFCLVKNDNSPTPNDDIKTGRKSPFISSRCWPKALRTRSASKERVSSRQGILQNSIEQIKAFQESKIPESYFPPRHRDSKSDSSCDRSSLTKSTSLACISTPGQGATLPKGILKTSNHPHVPRVNERIQALQSNIDKTKTQPLSTLPWNSKLCKADSGESMLRKTASSPCLFVKKSCVKIKTRQSPIKLYGTMTNVTNLLEEKLSNLHTKELHEWESNENDQQLAPRDTACMGKSHEQSDNTFPDEVPARRAELRNLSSPPYNCIPSDNLIKPFDEARRTIDILESEVKRTGRVGNEHRKTAENVTCIQNEQLKFNEITSVDKIQNDDIPQRGSTRTGNKETSGQVVPQIQFPHTTMEDKDFIENVNISRNNSICSESEDIDRPQNSTCLSYKQIGLPSGLGATSEGMAHGRTCDEKPHSQTCDKLLINDHVLKNNIYEKNVDNDESKDKNGQPKKDILSIVLNDKENSNENTIVSNSEHINSSEDEEIKKELSSILTNECQIFKGQLPRPRRFNNPFMNGASTNRLNLKNSQNYANTHTVISESNFVGLSNSIDTWRSSAQEKHGMIDLNISENVEKSSCSTISELEDGITKLSISELPRPIISEESAKLISCEQQEKERSVEGPGNEIKGGTKSAPQIPHLCSSGVGVHNMFGAVPRLLGSKQFRTEREGGKSDLYPPTCAIQSGIFPAQLLEQGVVVSGKRSELEQSDLSESGSHQDESSPPRDSPSPESSSSESECTDDEFSRIRKRNFNTRRGSMPEREIDEEDTETAELQVNLRKISGRSFIPGVKLDSDGKDENESPKLEIHAENDESKNSQIENSDDKSLPEIDSGSYRRLDRRGSMPEREINEDDTETAEFQTNLRKLSAKSQDSDAKSQNDYKSSSEIEDEIAAVEEIDSPNPGNCSSSETKTPAAMDQEEENKQIFRPAIPARGRTPGGLRRSRTWQGFGSGLRYESVSDAGLPPPPPTPDTAKSVEGPSRCQLPATRQSLPRSYRPLSNLRRNPESGPKSWRRPTGSAFLSTTPIVGHSTLRSLGEQGGIARSLSEGNVVREWEDEDEEVEYDCRVTCSVRQPNQDIRMSVENMLSEDTSGDSKMKSTPIEAEEKVEEDDPSRDDLTPAQIQQLMSVIAGMESIKKAGGEDGKTGTGSGSPPPTDEEIQQFIEYVGMGVINNDRLEYEERRRKDQEEENQPEPPKRNKQASQYFWRRHYLSIIQEDDEEHNEQTPGSSRSVSRANSRPGSTYENNFNRLSKVLGAMSPLAMEQRGLLDTSEKVEAIRDIRASWGSEMSVDSLTSINSILSEEGSITSNGSFVSDSCPTELYQNVTSCDQVKDTCQKRASQSLSCLLDSVHPPSNTPDSMMSCESPTVRLSKSETENDDGIQVLKFKMGSKFKQSIQEIEESKKKDGEDEHQLYPIGRGTTCFTKPGAAPEEEEGRPQGDRTQCGRISISPNSGHGGSSSGRGSDSPIQVDPISQAEEAKGGKKILGDIKQSFLRLEVNPLASPRQGRKNLTISTLIAECEEYVKTDEFTKDLSDKLVTLFRGEAANNSSTICNAVQLGNQHQVLTKPEPKVVTEESDKMKKPPKIPESMRTKPVHKVEKPDKLEKVEKSNIPKFPVSLRGSTYDNVGDSEAEDEGIDNDYSDDSGTTATPSSCSFCQVSGCEKHESSPALTSEGYDSAYESDKKHMAGDLGCQDPEKAGECENWSRKLDGKIEHKKQNLNPFLTSEDEENNRPNPFKTEIKNTNPFENDSDSLNPFEREDDNNPFNENELSTSEVSIARSLTASQNSITEEMNLSNNESFEDYESVISDIEETLSILSRNSRSTTPASEMCGSSRTPTPSFGQINYFSMSDLSQKGHKSVSDKHVIPIVTVFDDLKDYLSDSDVSLDYKIALQRRKQKNMKNLNKQAQLSSFLTSKRNKTDAQELGKFKPDKTRNDDNADYGRHMDTLNVHPTRSLTCPNIFQQAQECRETSPQVSPSNAAKNNDWTKTLPNIVLRENTSTNNHEIPNCQEMTLHKEALSKHKQENDCAVKKINSSLDLRTRRSPSLTRGKSLEPIVEEASLRPLSRNPPHQGVLKGCEVVKVSGYAVEGQISQPTSHTPDLSNRCKSEKLQYVNEESNTGSLKRKKQLQTASLSDLLQETYEKPGKTEQINALDPLSLSYPKSKSETLTTSFAKSFQATSSKVPVFTRLAVNKSVSECNLNQWIGKPQLTYQTDRQTNTPTEQKYHLESNPKNVLRSSVSEHALNVAELDIIRNYMGLSPSVERLRGGESNLRKGQVGEKWGGNCKIGETYDHEHGTREGQQSRNNQRSASLEPENLHWWGQGGHIIATHGDQDGYNTDTGVSYGEEVAPVEGIFYAKPALLDSDSDSEVDTDTDAQTVIYKSSPYSSPGLALSRSASMTMTPLPLSPLTMTPQPPVSPEADSPPPPPRPPPPVNYIPSCDQFSSLPRNWRAKKKFLES